MNSGWRLFFRAAGRGSLTRGTPELSSTWILMELPARGLIPLPVYKNRCVMSISRVKVGLSLRSSRTRTGGAMKWNGKTRSNSKKESIPRIRLTRPESVRKAPETRYEAQPAVPDLAAPPLSFLSLRNFCLLTALAVMGVLLVWGMVRSNHQAINHGYEIYELTQKKTRLLETNRRLNAELISVSSLDQLEKVARENLGMITPQQGQIVVID